MNVVRFGLINIIDLVIEDNDDALDDERMNNRLGVGEYGSRH